MEQLWAQIAEDSARAADAFVGRIFDACERLASNPALGRARDELRPGVRSIPVSHYVVLYRVDPGALQVLRVVSGYRDLDAVFGA